MPAGSFDVTGPALRDGAVALDGDAEDLATAGTAAAAAAGEAGGAVSGGSLAEASAAFADVIGDRFAHMAAAAEGAGTTLRGNAATYELVDGGAATLLDGTAFDAAPSGRWPGAGDRW